MNKLTALDIFKMTEALPVTPLRAAVFELLDRRPDIDTIEVALALGHQDPRKALSDLTKLRRQGYLLNRPEPPSGMKGQARAQWRLSVEGKKDLVRTQMALAVINYERTEA